MIYLVLSILTSSFIVVAFKLFTRWGVSNIQAIMYNYLVAALLGYFLSGENISPAEIANRPWFLFAIICGTTLIITFNLYGLSTQKAGVAVTAVSGKMSVLIPVIFGFIMFKENAGIMRIAGIATALLAFYLTFYKKEKTKSSPLVFILPFLLFLGNGFNDSMLKIAQALYITNDYILFLSSAFFFSLFTGIIILVALMLAGKEKLNFRSALAGTGLGILNWYSTYYFLVSLSYFDVSFYVPVFSVSIVLISALIGYFVFKENLSRINIAGIILAAAAIILMASG